MKKCVICGKSEVESEIVRAIYSSQIQDICRECAENEGIAVMKKPTAEQLKESERPFTVDERLERLTGVKRKDKSMQVIHDFIKAQPRPKKQDYSYLKLIDNFQWHIKNARRRVKISTFQLARDIAESESVIKMIEEGQLPGEPKEVIRKLEQYLRIKLIKGDNQQVEQKAEVQDSLIGKQVEIIEDEPESETEAIDVGRKELEKV